MAKYCPYCVARVEHGNTCPHCNYSYTYTVKPHHLKPGTLLGGNRYLVGRVLGEGGFGITYLGRDLTLDMKVAIKEYFPSAMATRHNTVSSNISLVDKSFDAAFKNGREQFIKEAQTLADLEKENAVVTVRDFFGDNESAYIVMEFIEGEDLKSIIQRTRKPMRAQELLNLLEPVFSSLSKAHDKGLIHRDISPDNIMIEDGKARLIDFGCARTLVSGSAGETMLKYSFSPVEQYSNQNMGPWTDVYAMAATIYYCITGHLPPRATDRLMHDEIIPPSALGVNLPKKQERALMKALAVLPDNRYHSLQEFGKDLFIHRNKYKYVAVAACAVAIIAAVSFILFKPKEIIQTLEKENTVTEVLSYSDNLSAEEKKVLDQVTDIIKNDTSLNDDESNYYRIDTRNSTDYYLENVSFQIMFYDAENRIVDTGSSSLSKWKKGEIATPKIYGDSIKVDRVKLRISFDYEGKRFETEYLDIPYGKGAASDILLTLKNELPATFKSQSYLGTFQYEITSFSYKVSSSYEKGLYSMYLVFGGSLIRADHNGSNYNGMNYKITDASGAVITSGTVSFPALEKGERFENIRQSLYYDLPPGEYFLELSDYS